MTRLGSFARRYHGKHRGTRTRVARDWNIPHGWLTRCAEHVRDDSRSRLPMESYQFSPLEDFYLTGELRVVAA